MVTKAELVRTYCALTGRPVADTEHRAERLRKAGMLPTTGRGPYAARLNEHHVALCLIAFLAIDEPAIHAPEIVETYSNLLLDRRTLIMDEAHGAEHPPALGGGVATFLDILTMSLRTSQEQRRIGRTAIQRITLSRMGNTVRAAITIRDLSRDDCVDVQSFSTHAEPELPLVADGGASLLIEQQCAIDGKIIDRLADLLAKTENETSPSVDADRPDSLDDKPRGGNPEATTELLKT
jgi:hypothetical protein